MLALTKGQSFAVVAIALTISLLIVGVILGFFVMLCGATVTFAGLGVMWFIVGIKRMVDAAFESYTNLVEKGRLTDEF